MTKSCLFASGIFREARNNRNRVNSNGEQQTGVEAMPNLRLSWHLYSDTRKQLSNCTQRVRHCRVHGIMKMCSKYLTHEPTSCNILTNFTITSLRVELRIWFESLDTGETKFLDWASWCSDVTSVQWINQGKKWSFRLRQNQNYRIHRSRCLHWTYLNMLENVTRYEGEPGPGLRAGMDQ